jgi:hypothetical protein
MPRPHVRPAVREVLPVELVHGTDVCICRGFLVMSAVAAIRVYPRLASVERLALWWWIVIAVVAAAGLFSGPTYLVLGVAGVLMIGLGLFIAFNFKGIADKLGQRSIGVGPLWQQWSPAWWRFSGGVLLIISAFWALAFGSAF